MKHLLVSFFLLAITGELSGQYITGPRGGCYTISASGRKRYVDRSMCGSTAPAPTRATTPATPTPARLSPAPKPAVTRASTEQKPAVTRASTEQKPTATNDVAEYLDFLRNGDPTLIKAVRDIIASDVRRRK